MAETDENPWRETVRDIYDVCYFGPYNVFDSDPLAQRLVAIIEKRHPGFFTDQQSAH
jgi:hypothetical protein